MGFYRHIHINHGPELERSIEEVKRVISVNENIRYKYSTRFLAIKLLENDDDLEGTVEEFPNGKEILEVRNREEQRLRNMVLSPVRCVKLMWTIMRIRHVRHA